MVVEPRIRRVIQLDSSGTNIGVQYPLSVDGDSVYSKDIWVDECTMGDFSGVPTDLFDNLHTSITNVTATDPKIITIHFNRGVISSSLALGAYTGNFSNVKIKLLGSGHTGYTVIDDSANNTKYTGKAYQFPIIIGFNAVTIEFHTTDTITISNCAIGKSTQVIARIQAVKPDNTVVDINATAGGNLKQSIEETEPGAIRPFGLDVSKGDVAGHSWTHKFGKHEDVQTTFEPLSIGGIYQTKQPASAIAMRVKIGNIADIDTTGAGARKVVIQGLDETGALQSEELSTNGAASGTAGTITWIRLFRAYISESGTYAGTAGDSAAADIVIEDTGGNTWLTIDKPDLSRGQSQVGQFTVPLGKTAYVYSYLLTTDSGKAVDFLFFKREGILDAAAPYQARRTVVEEIGVQGHLDGRFEGGQKFEELTDIGWMVKAAATALATVDYEILLIDN